MACVSAYSFIFYSCFGLLGWTSCESNSYSFYAIRYCASFRSSNKNPHTIDAQFEPTNANIRSFSHSETDPDRNLESNHA